MPIFLSLMFVSFSYFYRRQRKFERKINSYLSIIDEELDQYSEQVKNLEYTMRHLNEIAYEVNEKEDLLLEEVEKSKNLFNLPRKKKETEIN